MKITATIPVGQYANIQPEVEGETADECMRQIRNMFFRYGVVTLNDRGDGSDEIPEQLNIA